MSSNENRPLRICSIGCGGMSTFAHGPSYARYAAENPGTELLACCDLDEDKAVKYRDSFGFARHYTNTVEMLERERPDAVCLVVQEHQTCELACTILEMGFPMITEKPPGRTVEEIDRMIAAAGKAGVATQVALNRRYTPLVAELKARLTGEHDAPDIQHIRYEFTRVRRTDADFTLTAIHGIDTARFLAGSDFRHIRFHYREFPELGPTTGNLLLDCTYKSGATGQIEFCPVSGVSTERAAVHLYDHSYFLNISMFNEADDRGALRHFHADKLVETISADDTPAGTDKFVVNGFYAENESFFNDIRAGRRPAGSLEDARQSVEVAECLRERRAEYTAP